MLSIRTQDRMALVPFDGPVYILERKDYREESIKKIEDMNENFKTYMNPLTNKMFKSQEEVNAWISDNIKKETYYVLYIKSREGVYLGEYKSLDRSLHVLDEIEKASLGDVYLEREVGVAVSLPNVYKMPLDSEEEKK